MERRDALRLISGLAGAWTQPLTITQTPAISFLDWNKPITLMLMLDQWATFQVSYKGETITIDPADFAALKEGKQ